MSRDKYNKNVRNCKHRLTFQTNPNCVNDYETLISKGRDLRSIKIIKLNEGILLECLLWQNLNYQLVLG